jgi:hypothetical protein
MYVLHGWEKTSKVYELTAKKRERKSLKVLGTHFSASMIEEILHNAAKVQGTDISNLKV